MATRTLTVLFTDIVGSTAMLSRLPVREAERLRQNHFATLHEEIECSGGRLVKTLGDGVLGVFESAAAGLTAAIAMQRSTSGTARIRAGLSSGDVTLDGGDCFGAAVVEASRLCAQAVGGQVLASESTRLIARPESRLSAIATMQLKGMPEPTTVWEAIWSPASPALRVVLADDAVLVREGVARVLEDCGIEVVAQAGDAEELLRFTDTFHPDLAIIDVRMPPTYTIEGLLAAEHILATRPRTGVLVLSQDVQPHYAARLRSARGTGVGYLLKEHVADIRAFARAARRVASGGEAFELDDGGFS